MTTPPPDLTPAQTPTHGVTMHMSPRHHARYGDKLPSLARAEHCTMVIFGATGDLTKRKLFPALYQLAAEHLLGPGFAVLAVGREAALNDESFRERMRAALAESDEVKRVDEEVWQAFEKRIFFVGGDATDAAAYEGIKKKLDEIESECVAEERNRFFYLAVPPSVFEAIVRLLSSSGLVPRIDDPNQRPWARVVVEKPFGRSLATAHALNQLVLSLFAEHQVYRIDHFLGKETVQNVLVLRFANSIWEPLWNRRWVSHVEITAAETVGVEQRAGYYDKTGALRDMVQNHLMQLLTLVAMEPPIAFTADSVRDRKMDALLSVQPIGGVVRGQYGAGWVNGSDVPGYRQEPGVAEGSQTETFAALRLHLDSWRWADVPFYVRTGKRLPKRTTEIAIQFRRPPLEIFKKVSASPVSPNLLIVNVQPDEGISIRFEAKVPGTRMQLAPVRMNFRYGHAFGGSVPEAYETLLLDAMLGDATLFARHDFVEASWALITPVHQRWASGQDPAAAVAEYEAGEWGPAAADALMEQDGRRWRTL